LARTQYGIDPTKWRATGGDWSVVSDNQQDGTRGGVALGATDGNQILYSTLGGTDYVLEAFARAISGRVFGVAARAHGPNDLYEDLNWTDNLYLYNWPSGLSYPASTLKSVPVGPIVPNTWYNLTVKVHSSQIEVLKDNVLLAQAFDNTWPSGGVGLYGENGTV